jgi:hypothetical protein
VDEVIERIKAQFSTIYLTLISVIQASVLSYAMVCTDGLLHGLTARTAILLTTTFLIIVLNWNEYVMGSTTFRWVPTVVDSFLPFLIGASEFLMVRSLVRDGVGWYFWLAAFCLLGCMAFINQYRQARRLPENAAVFVALGRWTRSTEILLLAISVFAVAMGFIDISLPGCSPIRTLLAVAALAGTVAYLVRTVFYWRRITRHVPAVR